jgi:acyl-CoA thioester hydrolase
MTEQRKLLIGMQIVVRWADLDANGHVNNATYFTYFEQARIAWLESLGAQDTADGCGPVIAQTGCSFARAIGYPETLEVRVYGGPPGRSSFPTFYEIVSGADTTVKYADGQAVMVWVNRDSGKSRPLPERLRAALD